MICLNGNLIFIACLSIVLSGVAATSDAPALAAAAGESADEQKLTPLEQSVEPFYSLTEGFLDLIQPKMSSILLDDITNFTFELKYGSHLPMLNNTADTWRRHAIRYAIGMPGYLALICFGLLFIVGLPIIGFVLCCCRCCCGKCGGSLHQMERKGAKCRRVLYGLTLATLVTFMLCGIVLALISNQLMYDSLKDDAKGSVISDIQNGLSEVGRLLQTAGNATVAAEKKLPDAVAKQLPAVAKAAIQSAIDDSLFNKSQIIKKANDAFDQLNKLAASAKAMELTRGRLKSAVANLSNENSQRLERLLLLNDPKFPLGDFDEKILLSAVGNFSTNLNEKINSMATTASDKVTNETVKAFKAKQGNALKQVNVTLSQLGDRIIRWAAGMDENYRSPVNEGRQNLSQVLLEADKFRYYGYVGVTCLPLLIIILYYLGLAYGFCGEPPYEVSRCCNRGVGANMLLSGSAFAFLFGWFIMLIVLLLFISGGVLDTELCRYLTGRFGPEGYSVLDQTATKMLNHLVGSKNNRLPDSLFSDLFSDCQQEGGGGSGVFDSVDVAGALRSRVFLDEWDKLASQISGRVAANREEVNRSLSDASAALRLSLTNSNISLTKAMERLQNFTTEIIKEADKLLNDANGMRQLLTEFASDADKLLTELKLINKQFSQLLSNIENRINAWSVSLINEKAFSDSLLSGLKRSKFQEQLLNSIADIIKQQLAIGFPCERVSAAASLAFGSPCRRLLRPFNGYWAGLGFFLICLLPCLIITVKLANLYRKTNKYEKDYEEPDYMAYQGFYPGDTIPLDARGNRCIRHA